MKKLNELQSYLTRLRGLMLTLIILCSIGSGNVWGATYTITFKTASSDPSTAISTSETITNIVSEGSSNIKSLNTCSKCYGPAKSGLKLGTGSATGTFKFTLSDALAAKTIRSVTVKTVAYGTDGGNITGTATGTNAGSLGTIAKGTDLVKDYTASSTTKITTIQVATSTKRAYISQIIIETIEATPTLTVSPSSITSGLTYVYGSGPSSAQTFTVSGSNLTANVTVSAPTNFEVSKDGSSYAASQTITASSTLSATTIYVRLKSGLAVNSYSGNITVASTGATSKNVSLSGSVTAPSYTVGWSITSGGGTLSTTSGMSTTVTPASGYRYASPAYTVLTGAATVVQSTNTFTATPTANSTIRINMEEIPSHTLSFNTGGLVSIPSVSVLEGATYNISQTPAASLSEDCEYATFVGWTTASSIADASVCPTIITSYTMSTSDVTLYAVYSKTEGGSGDYELVESNLGTDWAGDYLIAYSADIFADGRVGGTGTGGIGKQYVNIDPDDNLDGKVVDADWGDTYHVTLEEISENSNTYLLKTQDNQYNYYTTNSSNGLSSTTTRATAANYPITVTFTSSSDVKLCLGGDATGSVFRYNTSEFFRYYKDCGQNAVYLYKKSSGTTTYSMSANCNMPTITVSTDDINFGDKKASSDRSISHTATFTVSGANLNEDIALSISGGQYTLFSVDKYTLEEDGGTVATTTITVTWTPSAASNQTDIHINSDGATEKIVHVHGTGKWEVTWMSHGGEHTTTLVASGTLPDFPAEDPTSCDLESSSFYGWTTEEWTGKLDNLAGKTVYSTNSGMATVSDNNRVYYAVFAKGTGSGSECYKKVTSTGDISSDGRYLIVYATGKVAFKGSLTSLDVTENTIDVTFDGSDITADATTKANEFTIDMTNLYVKSASDRWIEHSGWSNGLGGNTSATAVHSISIDGSENLVILGTGNDGNGTYVQLKYNAAIDQKRFRFFKSGQEDIQLYKYDPGVTYSKFLTNCCNTPTLAFAASPYSTIRQDIGGASTTTWAEVDVTFTSDNTTGTISVPDYGSGKSVYKMSTWESRSTSDVSSLCATTHAYFEVLTQPSGGTPGTGKFHVKTTTGQTGQGTYRIAITQAATDESHGNFCETTVYGFVDVTLRDKFVDQLNDNGTVNRDGHGAQLATPTLSQLSSQDEDACHDEERKLKGWIKETDLKAQYETGNSTRVQSIDGLCESCDPASDQKSLVVAPGENITTSGATWYAVWAYER